MLKNRDKIFNIRCSVVHCIWY